jgi:TonB family protein
MTFRYVIPVLLLCFISSLVFSQATEPPKPVMTKILLKDFLSMHLQYPEEAIDRGEQGTVRITFETDREGKVLRRAVIQSVSPSVDSAALSLFDMILWEPAKYYGKPKNGNGEFKIKYNISRYESLVKKRGYDLYSISVDTVDKSGEIFTIKELDKSPEAILDSSYKTVPNFIKQNLEFPEAAAKLNIEGDVKLRFVIETNGLPSNITVVQTVGGGCTEEAIRILNLIKWEPGIHENMAVRTCYYLSIKFDAPEELRNKHIPNQTSSGI